MFTLFMVALPLPCSCLTMALCLPTVTPLYGPVIWQHRVILMNPASPKKVHSCDWGAAINCRTQDLLEPSRALLCIVPNPHSDCDQAGDSKGNTNTLLDSGCLSIFPVPLFVKKKIKRRTACGFLFSWDSLKFWEQNRVDFVASSHFFVLLKIYWICKVPARQELPSMGRAECIFYSTVVTPPYYISGKAQLSDHQFIPWNIKVCRLSL